MAIEAELPDGRVLEFPDGTDPRVIQTTVKRVLGVGKESTISGEAVRGVKQLISSGRTAVGALTGDAAQAGIEGVQRGQEIAEEAGEGPSLERIRRVYNEKGLVAAGRQVASDIPRAVAGQAGTLASMYGLGKLGAMAGAPAGPVGAFVGGAAGATAALLPQLFGSNIERQVAEQQAAGEPVNPNLGRAGAAAAGQAALESVGTGLVLGKRVISSLLGISPTQLASDVAKQKLLREASRTLAGGVARGAAVEMPVEVAQSVIERAQAGLDLTSDDALAEYGEAAYGAAIVGGPLGGVGTAVGRGGARRDLAAREAAEAPAVEPTPEEPPTAAGSLAARAPTDLSVGELYQEEARLSALLAEGRQPKEVVDRIREVRKLKREYNISAAEDAILQRTALEQEKARAAQSVFSEETLPEVVPREGFTPPEAITSELLVEAGLPAEPTTAKQKGVAKWFTENIVGRTVEEVRDLLKKRPDYLEGNGLRAKILRDLTTTTPMPFEEKEIGRLDDAGIPESAPPELGGDQPSVGLPSGVSDVGGAPATPGAPSAPVDGGVEATALPAQPGDGPEVREPVAVVKPQAAAPAPELAPFIDPASATPETETALTPYVQRMQADGASSEQFPRYLGWDVMSGSKFDPQTSEFTRIGFAPDTSLGITPQQARTVFASLKPEVQEQVLDEARNYFVRERESVRERRRKAKDEAEAAQESTDLEGLEEGAALDVMAERAGRRPRITETPTGRTVEGIQYQEGVQGEVPLAQSVRDELDQNNVADALHELSKTTSNPLYAQIARRLMRLLGDTNVVIDDDLRNPEGKPAAGAASTNGRMIWLDRNRGLNEETLLHESVHAASEFVLSRKPADRTAEQNAAVRELDALWEAAKADPDITLSPDAQANLSEFVTEALTNPALIKDLQAKPWTFRNAWESFKRTLLNMLGIKSPSTMNEAAIAAMDTIFQPSSMSPGGPSTGKRFQLAPNVEAALKSQDRRQVLSVGAAIKGAFRQGLGLPGAVNANVASTESKVRTMFADKAATVFDKLGEAVNKGMISAMDSAKTKALFKQAEAKDQLVPDFLRKGVLELDKKLGLWKVTSAPKGEAPSDALEIIKKWGEKKKLKSFDDAWEYAARMIESGRQYEFRRQNALAKPGAPQLPMTKGFPIDELYPAYKADADLQKVKDILDKARIRLIDNMVAVGRLSAQEGAAWKAAAEYIPFDRLEQFGEKIRQQKRTGRGLASLGKLPELVDASLVDRPVGNALENYFKTLGWMVEQTVQTDALNKTLAQLQAIGEAKAPVRTKAQIQNPTLAVRGYRNGEEIWYEVPSIYHAAAFNSQVGPLPKIIEVFGTISRTLRTSITALPTFTASQLPQDIQRAIIYSGVKNPAALTAKALSNFSVLSKYALKGTLYEGAPIQSAFGVVGDVDFRRNDPAASLLEELGYADRKTLGSKKVGLVLHRLNELARASDIAIRKSIYEQTLEETGDQLLALQRAREIINFRTTGMGDPLGALPILIQTIPFFNAFIQGTDVLYRGLTGKDAVSGLARNKALWQFYKMAGALAAGSTIYALMMAGDDEYENTSLEERDKSWILGGGFSIPVPSEIGMIFKAIPERVTEAVLKNGTPDEKAGMIALSSWFRAAFMEYGGRVIPIPAATKPILEAWTGYSSRTGRPLEGTFQKELDAEERTTGTTSEFAKEVARFVKETGVADALKNTLGVEISPIKIDNTLTGYFGTTMLLTLAATDGLINPNRADRPLHQIVGLSAFTYDPVGRRRTDEFYDLREKVVTAQNTLNALVKQDLGRAQEYVEKNRPRLLAYKAVNETLQQLKVTRQYKQWLDTQTAAQQMSSEERMLKKREIQAYEQKLVGWVRMARKELDL